VIIKGKTLLGNIPQIEVPMTYKITPSDIDMESVDIELDKICRREPVIQLNHPEANELDLDCKVTRKSINFGAESYQTPVLQVKPSSLLFTPPLAPKGCKRKETNELDYRRTRRKINFGTESYQIQDHPLLVPKTEIKPAVHLSQLETNEINYKVTRKAIDFGADYQTPLRQVRTSSSSPIPLSLQKARRKGYQSSDRSILNGYEYTNYLNIPSIESSKAVRYSQSSKIGSFQLQPRAERNYGLQPSLRQQPYYHRPTENRKKSISIPVLESSEVENMTNEAGFEFQPRVAQTFDSSCVRVYISSQDTPNFSNSCSGSTTEPNTDRITLKCDKMNGCHSDAFKRIHALTHEMRIKRRGSITAVSA